MILTLGLTAVVVHVAAQAPQTATPKAAASAPKAAAAKKASGPRTPDGHPDLQGTYDLATITPLERRPGPVRAPEGSNRRRPPKVQALLR